jgi:hypothetical protein
MPELQVLLNEDELNLLRAAFNQLNHEHESVEQLANATLRDVFCRVDHELNAQTGHLMT